MKAKRQIKEKSLKEMVNIPIDNVLGIFTASVIFCFTLLGYSCAYSFEYGYATAFNIPKEFIQINSRILYEVSLFVLFLCFLSIILLLSYRYLYDKYMKGKINAIYLLIGVPILFTVIRIFIINTFVVLLIDIVWLSLAIYLLFEVIKYIREVSRLNNEHVELVESITKCKKCNQIFKSTGGGPLAKISELSKRMARILSFRSILFVGSILGAFITLIDTASTMGYTFAQTRRQYSVIENTDRIILARYGDLCIVGKKVNNVISNKVEVISSNSSEIKRLQIKTIGPLTVKGINKEIENSGFTILIIKMLGG